MQALQAVSVSMVKARVCWFVSLEDALGSQSSWALECLGSKAGAIQNRGVAAGSQ